MNTETQKRTDIIINVLKSFFKKAFISIITLIKFIILDIPFNILVLIIAIVGYLTGFFIFLYIKTGYKNLSIYILLEILKLEWGTISYYNLYGSTQYLGFMILGIKIWFFNPYYCTAGYWVGEKSMRKPVFEDYIV
jgi:hypothetical protein